MSTYNKTNNNKNHNYNNSKKKYFQKFSKILYTYKDRFNTKF